MDAQSRLNKLLPSGIVLTTILGISTFTISLVAQNAATAHEYVQPNAVAALHPAASPLKPTEGLNGPSANTAVTDAPAGARVTASYGKLPISFEVNQGQTDGSVQFLARGMGYTLFLTPGEAVLALHAAHPVAASGTRSASTASPSIVRMQLIGGNTKAQVVGVDRLPGDSNYFIGNDRAKWHTDVPTYAKVRYSDVYPGVDLVYYGNQEGRLEHDFIVAPGADPSAIAIGLRANEGAVPDGRGGLTLHTKTGELSLRTPVVYQEIGGQRKVIPAAYELAKNGEMKFRVGSYDKRAPLVIDPVWVYTGEFGSLGGSTNVNGIAVDSSGNTYVAGNTTGQDHWALVNAYPNPWTNQSGGDVAFVAKINAAGTALIYSNIFACGSYQFETTAVGIAVDSAGRAYIAGSTGAPLPLTSDAYQSNIVGAVDAYLTIFTPAGNALAYSTYLGGSGYQYVTAMALDASNSAYITGYTINSPFPRLHSLQSNGSLFVAKFNSAGVLQYSSVFGGSGSGNNATTFATAMAVDSSGFAYLAGTAVSPGIPTVTPALQTSCATTCGFVTKLGPTGGTLGYSTYFPQIVNAIAVDSSGGAYIAGTTGAGFPAHQSGYQKTYGGGSSDGYVAKLNVNGSAIVWATYLGGSGADLITGMALDQYRTVYVTGYTNSPNFPLKAPVETQTPGNNPGNYRFVTTLSGSLGAINYYSLVYGYPTPNPAMAPIAVDKALNVYAATNADTNGFDIDVTPGSLSDGRGVAVTKFVIMDDIALGVSAVPSPVVHGGNLTYTIAVTSKGPDFGYNVRLADTLPAGTTFVSYDAGGGSCVAPAVGGTGTMNCTLPQLNNGATWNVKLTVNVNAASGTNLSNTAAAISNMQDFVPANNSGTLTVHVN